MSVPTYPKMADFDDLPGEFDPNQPDALWVPRDGPTPPKYFSVDTHKMQKML
jgi:hypothetical protein